MPFGLKNAGATYQRAMMAIFHDMIHIDMEVYVDDILVKSKTRSEHPRALAKILQRSQEHNLKMNPKKCVFGVSSEKLLGFIVSKRGIVEVSLPKLEGAQSVSLISRGYHPRILPYIYGSCHEILPSWLVGKWRWHSLI